MVSTTVINLIGGPGCGKSTLAAELYAKMKRKRMNVEMVREVAKEWAWEGKKIGPFEQLAILGEQIKREGSLYTKVKYVVTDSPVVLGAFYFEHNHKQIFANQMIRSYYMYAEQHKVTFINVVLPRNKEYDPEGRFENEKQAKEIDKQIYQYLKYHNYPNQVIDQDATNEQIIIEILENI